MGKIEIILELLEPNVHEVSKQLCNVLPHLMLPVRPVMPALRTPIIQIMMNPLARKDVRKAI